jgi:hypothetical protein
MTRLGYMCMSILVVGACTDGLTDDSANPNPDPAGAASGQGNTFDHPNPDQIDPFALADRLAEEGPPRYTSHVHSCAKMPISTLGHMLTGFGVAITGTGVTPGGLYTSGFNAMGEANFPNRIRENISVTTAGASREFDIFAAAAPGIITSMPTLARCMNGAAGPAMFDTSGGCTLDGITCLMGVPATSTHVALCNLTVTSASTVAVGKNLAVAVILAASQTCL